MGKSTIQKSASPPVVMVSQATNSQQKLSTDVLWYMGKHLLTRPTDIYALARVNRRTWAALSHEIYRADVKYTRELEERHQPSDYDTTGYTLQQIHDGRMRVKGPASALHWAVAKGIVTTADKAIAAAKDIWPAYIDSKDANGQSPIHLGADRGNQTMISKLISAGCYAHALSMRYMWPCKDYLGHRGLPILWNDPVIMSQHKEDVFAVGALDIAISQGFEDIALGLIKQDHIEVGWPQLSMAAYLGSLDIARCLLDAGHCVGEHGALHSAASRPSNLSMLKFLLEEGADVNEVETGFTPLFYALWARLRANADLLLDSGAQPDFRADDASEPLWHSAIRDDLLPITKRLLSAYQHNRNEAIAIAIFETIDHLDVAFETFEFLISVSVTLKGVYRRSFIPNFHQFSRKPRHGDGILNAIIQSPNYKREALELVLNHKNPPELYEESGYAYLLDYAVNYKRLDAVACICEHGSPMCFQYISRSAAVRLEQMCNEANIENPLKLKMARS
ncbi:ankyrin repeat-containing domain protein [Xylariaceae sp. FL0662B]|nr:ankyrin repeat-containing domain protein [Xylariaceae sp. FL0662B]